MSIPYMGSKSKLAVDIVQFIANQNPNAKHFYDLFGGGGSISVEAIKSRRFNKVYYNELNTGVTNLMRKIKAEGITYEFYSWVSREEFNEYKNGNDWWSGFIKSCWSFGNNQKDYLYSKDIEYWKKALHTICFCDTVEDVIVNFRVLEKRVFKKPTDYTIFFDDSKASDLLKLPKGSQRRYKLKNCILGRSKRLESLESLERLERLESLESLQRLESLEISNLSYEDVKITTPIHETVIYCDPPYKSTSKYQKDINHDLFLEWVKKSPYKIYVSSYDFDLPIVKSFSHRSTLSATANNKVVENLYCNQIEELQLTLF